MKPKTCLIAVMLAAALACQGQQAPAPKPENPPAPGTSEERIKALEQKVADLEEKVTELTAALSATSGAPAAPTAAAPASSSTTTAYAEQAAAQAPTLGGAAGQAKALNPDISAIGDFVGDAGHNRFSAFRSLEMHEAEVALQAIVDPYARADFFLSFGEEGVNLEEGYITFTALPQSFVAKVGKMRSAFGKVNTLHNHVLPWVDRPLVTYDLVGGEDGINDAGVSLQRILPAPKWLFLEATGQVFRGDSADVFHAAAKDQLSTVAHLRGYHDLTDNTNLDIGLSYARGHNDAPFGDFITNLYGVDATLRWKPLQRAIYHSFLGRAEFVWNQRQQLPATRRGFGWYASADYQLGRRWFLGGRYDWSAHQTNNFHDSGGSAVLTYWPSEFAQIRAQFRHTAYGPFANAPGGVPALNPFSQSTNELLMQVQFAIGAHGAHPF